MTLGDQKPSENQLDDFFSLIYGDTEGFAYLALKNPDSNQMSWKQEWFAWPSESVKLITRVEEQSSKYEVYYGPALYASKKATKQNVLGSTVLWVELDNLPKKVSEVPEPTVRVRSSLNTEHEHWYWKLDVLVDVPELERYNYALASCLGADISGWDSTQVLRPPFSYNHKRKAGVGLTSKSSVVYSIDNFQQVPTPPKLDDVELEEDIPAIEDVIAKYKFPGTVWMLFKKGVPEGSRSDGLMALGYSLAEMQLPNHEILALLLNADQRWGKFAGRNDQVRRLSQIVSIARNKYPLITLDPVGKFQTYGFLSLLNTEIHLEWVWEGLLQEAGYFLLSGPPGVGKTQFALDFSQRAALGQNFLERNIGKPRRIGFLSLEMGHADLKFFAELQGKSYNKEELDMLEENLRFLPLGEPLYLNKEQPREALEEWIYEEKLEGVVIDSLGSTTEQELSQESDVKTIMDFNDRLRQRHNVFTMFVHHHRKASGDNKKPNKLADVYGNQYITARATTVFCLWDGSNDTTLTGIPLKVRLSKKPDPLEIYRDAKLHFTLLKSGITVAKKEKGDNEVTQEDQGDIVVTKKFGL